MFQYPYDPCMEYLLTLALKITQSCRFKFIPAPWSWDSLRGRCSHLQWLLPWGLGEFLRGTALVARLSQEPLECLGGGWWPVCRTLSQPFLKRDLWVGTSWEKHRKTIIKWWFYGIGWNFMGYNYNNNWLVVFLEHDCITFPFSWECRHPNWRSLIFFRGMS